MCASINRTPIIWQSERWNNLRFWQWFIIPLGILLFTLIVLFPLTEYFQIDGPDLIPKSEQGLTDCAGGWKRGILPIWQVRELNSVQISSVVV